MTFVNNYLHGTVFLDMLIANGHSTFQEITSLLKNTNTHYYCHNRRSILRKMTPVHTFLSYLLIYAWTFQEVSSLQVPDKMLLEAFISLLYVPQITHSLFQISSIYYLLNSSNYEAHHYADFSSHLLLPLSYILLLV